MGLIELRLSLLYVSALKSRSMSLVDLTVILHDVVVTIGHCSSRKHHLHDCSRYHGQTTADLRLVSIEALAD